MGQFEEMLKSHSEEIVDLDRDLKLHPGDCPIVVEEFRPTISYDLLIYKNHSEFCFTNPILEQSDFHIYFEKMKEVTGSTMSDLIEGNTSVDFRIYDHAKLELRNFFFSAINSNPSAERTPSFGRIGLYNSEDEEGKAPRIFFAIGHYSTLHIFLCDPKHELYKNQKTK